MNAYGISVNNVAAVGIAHPYKAKLLLQQAQQKPQTYAQQGAKNADHTPFKQEDARYLAIGCTQIAKRYCIVALINNKHRQRAYNIKAGHNKDKREENIGHKLLNLHNFECVGLLFISVFYDKTAACNLLYPAFGCIEISIGFQA